MHKKGAKKLSISPLDPEPPRNGSLPRALVARIEVFARIFEEVDGRPPAQWVKDFQQDQNPEEEVAIWELVAATYAAFTENRSLALPAKKEAFHLLLLRSMHDKQRAPREVPLKYLDQAEAVALFVSCQSIARVGGHGFCSAPPAPSITRPSSADRPGTPSAPSIDEAFTIRDEANALTAFAFRNGFIEELHAGKWSPLLDQPGCSRITDDEMRRLMIEASEKLAQMLRLKRSDPDQYEAQIRDYHEKYCRTWKRE